MSIGGQAPQSSAARSPAPPAPQAALNAISSTLRTHAAFGRTHGRLPQAASPPRRSTARRPAQSPPCKARNNSAQPRRPWDQPLPGNKAHGKHNSSTGPSRRGRSTATSSKGRGYRNKVAGTIADRIDGGSNFRRLRSAGHRYEMFTYSVAQNRDLGGRTFCHGSSGSAVFGACGATTAVV